MILVEELKRLDSISFEAEPNRLIAELMVHCKGDSYEVLEKTREVLKKTIDCELSFDDSIDDWKAILPKWFVDKCSIEITKEEAQKILSETGGYERLSKMWTISGFIYWFRPNERNWYWWGAEIRDEDTLVIHLLVDGFPFAWGALDWLLKVAGAEFTEENY